MTFSIDISMEKRIYELNSVNLASVQQLGQAERAQDRDIVSEKDQLNILFGSKSVLFTCAAYQWLQNG
jgi:hypothetical protein